MFDNFNSIKVRLEQAAHLFPVDPTTFQFHKGTIRTGSTVRYKSFDVEFQFHKGTIRTSLAATFFTCSGISIP